MHDLILTEEGACLKRCQDKETRGVDYIDLTVVNHIHVVDLRSRFEHLLEVSEDFDVQVAHHIRDEPLVLLRITQPEQRVLDEKRLETLNFVFLGRINQFYAKFGRHVLEQGVFESLLGGVDELLR